MKRMLVFVVAAAAATACDDNPTGAQATRYDLIDYFGRPVPADVTAEIPGEPVPACRDTIVSGHIELETGSSGARQAMRFVRNCGGQRTSSDNQRTGTYVMKADTVQLTWSINNEFIGRITESAILAGNQLRIPFTVYTEADPDGTEISIIYQRR